MTNTTAVLSLWVLTAAGVQLGTLWIMKTSILPMLNALPYDRYVNVCHLIDMHVFHPIAVWNGITSPPGSAAPPPTRHPTTRPRRCSRSARCS